MSIFVSFFSVGLSFLSIFLTLLTYGSIRNKVKNPIVIDFVTFLSVIVLLMWHFLPSLLRLFSGSQFEVEIGIMPSEILMVYFLEFISLVIFYIVILISFRVTKISLIYVRIKLLMRALVKGKEEIVKIYLIRGDTRLREFVVFSMIMSVLGFYVTFSRALTGGASIAPLFDWILLPVVNKTALFFLLHLVFVVNLQKRRVLGFIVFFLFSLLLVMNISGGSHGNIVAPAIYLFFYNIFHNHVRSSMVLVMCSIIFLAVFSEEMHQVRAYTQERGNKDISTVEKLNLIVNSTSKVSDTNTPGENILSQMEWRFGENSRMSVGLIRMYDKGMGAGFNPLLNSLYVLPRSWYEEKPIPGSVDGSELGLGMRLMHKEIRGTIWNMSGFFTALHSYWEFGFFGVFVISLLIGVYSSILLKIVSGMPYMGLPLIVSLYDTWWQMPKLWISEAVLQLTTIFIPIVIVWYLFKFCYSTLLFSKNIVRKSIN